MKPEDEKKFKSALGVLATLFEKELNKTLIGVYMTALKPFGIEQVEEAISKAMVSCRFMPKPVDIIELISGGQKQIEDRGLTVAHVIVAHLKANGARVFPSLDGDKTAEWLMRKRWPYYEWAAHVVESEIHWWVKEFTKAYNALVLTKKYLPLDAPGEVKQLTDGMLKGM